MLQPAESSWIEPLVLALYRPTVQLASRILHAVEVSQPSPRRPRLAYTRVAAAVATLPIFSVAMRRARMERDSRAAELWVD